MDETGDRGTGPKASRFFSMAGVVVAEEHYSALSRAVIEVKGRFGVGKGKPLHWKEHVKTFDRRQFVTRELAKVPGVTINYVIFEKAAIPETAGMRGDQSTFYNYTAGLMMERLLLTAQYWPGGMRDVRVSFGHVRGFDHDKTLDYFRIKKDRGEGWARWSLLEGTPKFLAMSTNSGMQAADQYAGMLSAAMNVDRFGGYEPHHLLHVRPQIRRSSAGASTGYGFKAMTRKATLQDYPWWPSPGL
ncbi:DUF3800 domain-containing protein [Frigoribacterium sp. PhB160]|uniref:DUF3800 domain-containing protein n=1 Tax=Frigoribacterium sp. PhB160 TaxID=2485192 RepID=UPI0013157F84|nr:DUF3800 domain-containing protein [Frigoribacterium sp. PhB160]